MFGNQQFPDFADTPTHKLPSNKNARATYSGGDCSGDRLCIPKQRTPLGPKNPNGILGSIALIGKIKRYRVFLYCLLLCATCGIIFSL